MLESESQQVFLKSFKIEQTRYYHTRSSYHLSSLHKKLPTLWPLKLNQHPLPGQAGQWPLMQPPGLGHLLLLHRGEHLQDLPPSPSHQLQSLLEAGVSGQHVSPGPGLPPHLHLAGVSHLAGAEREAGPGQGRPLQACGGRMMAI